RLSVTLVLLLSVLGLAAGGKVLALPVGGSHWLSMREALEGLKAKGHEVVVAAPEINLHIKPTDNFTMKMYPVPFTQEEMDKDFHAFLKGGFEEGSFLERFVRTYQRMKRLSDFAFISCEHLLYNKELMRYLEESKFDVVFTDPVIPCGPIVAEHLSVPSVYFLRGIPCGIDFEATQCPNPPSYVPRVFTEHTDHMSFLQRVKNLVFDVQNFFLCDFMYKPYSKLASEFLQRDVDVLDLLRKASVWLLRLDFVLDYPRPLMPNIILIAFQGGSFLERFVRIFQRSKKTSALFLATCEYLLNNKELIKYLEDSKFDALFTDPMLPCGQILAEHLSVPSVFLLQQIPCSLEFEATQCPRPHSYVPRLFSANTDHMNFLQRVKNVLFDIPNNLLCYFMFQPYSKLASEFLQRDVTVLDLLRNASIWLMRFDFVFHYPRPLMPNMVIIGGITCTHRKAHLPINVKEERKEMDPALIPKEDIDGHVLWRISEEKSF
uniref:glucuronosyltransferase n=1 Tax=Anas platyrhynchos TaxID=8839 RepID=A0A8B9TSM6_ANAPL